MLTRSCFLPVAVLAATFETGNPAQQGAPRPRTPSTSPRPARRAWRHSGPRTPSTSGETARPRRQLRAGPDGRALDPAGARGHAHEHPHR
jgi:hypothetical protein